MHDCGLGYIKDPYKNKTERAYANHLEMLKYAGEVLWYAYEGVRFSLGGGAWFTPDFLVMLADCTLECHEVKGHWREAARVRIKVASEKFPFRFRAFKSAKGGRGWEEEVF